MLIPFVSVSSIGLLVGAFAFISRRRAHTFGRGFFGAWAGFALGGTAAIVLDVISGSGQWVPLIGHLTAVAGAIGGQVLDLEPPEAPTRP